MFAVVLNKIKRAEKVEWGFDLRRVGSCSAELALLSMKVLAVAYCYKLSARTKYSGALICTEYILLRIELPN